MHTLIRSSSVDSTGSRGSRGRGRGRSSSIDITGRSCSRGSRERMTSSPQPLLDNSDYSPNSTSRDIIEGKERKEREVGLIPSPLFQQDRVRDRTYSSLSDKDTDKCTDKDSDNIDSDNVDINTDICTLAALAAGAAKEETLVEIGDVDVNNIVQVCEFEYEYEYESDFYQYR